jgi:hypothetical protein
MSKHHDEKHSCLSAFKNRLALKMLHLHIAVYFDTLADKKIRIFL